MPKEMLRVTLVCFRRHLSTGQGAKSAKIKRTALFLMLFFFFSGIFCDAFSGERVNSTAVIHSFTQ